MELNKLEQERRKMYKRNGEMNEMTHEINSNQSHPLDQYIEDNTNTNPTVAQDFNPQFSDEDKKK